jgi:hypothetical protein
MLVASRKGANLAIHFMKMHSLRSIISWVALAVAVTLPSNARAQWGDPDFYQRITVRATQPLASEPGNHAGIFTIIRIDTNSATNVSYTLTGTATNGVDYATVATTVALAAGQSETNIVITPVGEASATGYKTVELGLTAPGGRFYGREGGFNSAVVYIAYKYTNVAPTVSFIRPTNNTSFLSRPDIVLSGRASDSNGWVTSVEFFAGSTSLATVTNEPFADGPWWRLPARNARRALPPIIPVPQNNPYAAIWTNVPPGVYALTAVATDNAGLQTTSAPVNITVTATLPTPVVRLVTPASGSSFPSNTPINLTAAAGETGDGIATVEFLAGGVSLGVVTNNPVSPCPDLLAPPRGTNVTLRPYFFQWTNAPVGSNSVTARATDNNGTPVLSAPITVNVQTNVYHRRRWW